MPADYFVFASQLAKRVRAQLTDPHAAPCTRVELPSGTASFARAVADEFVVGKLSIISIDDGRCLREYERPQWRQAIVYDCDGTVAYTFLADPDAPVTLPEPLHAWDDTDLALGREE